MAQVCGLSQQQKEISDFYPVATWGTAEEKIQKLLILPENKHGNKNGFMSDLMCARDFLENNSDLRNRIST